MRAEAVIEVEERGGYSVVTRLRSDPPLTLRRTGDAEVHLVGSGAGPVGGDDLALRVRVGPGAVLTLRSVAASIVLPGPAGEPSGYLLDAVVGAGGRLVVRPEPQILVRGCDHHMRTHLRLAEGAALEWRDESVLGRHDEAPGSLLHRVRIDRAGVALLRSDLAIGPRWPESLGPGGIDGARAVGTLVLVGPGLGDGPDVAPPAEAGTGRCAALRLAADAVVWSAVGATAGAVRAALAAHPCAHVQAL